jgi:DNA polymerase-1
MPELLSKNGQLRAAAERETVNMPIQGTAADVLKKAMIDVHRELSRYNEGRAAESRMILTVHDELLFEAPESDAQEIAALVSHVMENAYPLDVPLTVDVGVGLTWKDAKP